MLRMAVGFLAGALAIGGAGLAPSAAAAGTMVTRSDVPAGAIIVKTGERRLYLGLGAGKALVYKVGVGRMGKQWSGLRMIVSKHVKPAWSPTAQIRRDRPGIANVVPGGSPKNPMGAAALLLSGDGQYAIHGTNDSRSIGGFVSYGCIRMYNDDVMDLYKRVSIGTPVHVVN